jgi:hypothetical protein
VIKAYENACTRQPFVLLQAVFSYAGDDDKARESAREWKGTLVDRHDTADVHDPAEIYRNGEDDVPDAMFTKQVICSSDPGTHV